MANVIQPPQNVRSAALFDVYGSSLAEFGDTTYITRRSDRWPTKVARGIGGFERNWGFGGSSLISAGATNAWSLALEHASLFYPLTDPTFDNFKPRRQVAAIIHGFNDAKNFGTHTGFRETFKGCLRAWLGLVRAHFYYPTSDSHLTFGTGWTSQGANTSFGNVVYKSRSAAGGTVTFPTTADFPGGYVTFYAAVNGAASPESWLATTTVDGVASTTLDATALGVNAATTLLAIRVPVTAGVHSIVATFNSIGASGMRFFGVTTEITDKAPLCIVVGTNATPVMPWNVTSEFTTTVKNNLNTDMQTVVAEFDRCSFAPVADILELGGNGLGDPMLIQDDVHFNEAGNDLVARRVLDVIRAAGIPGAAPVAPGARTYAGTPTWSAPEDQIVYDTTNKLLVVPTGVVGRTWRSVAPTRRQRAMETRGLKGESHPLQISAASATVATQQIIGGMLGFEAGDVVTSLCVCVSVAGAGTTPTTFKLGLVDTAGTVLAVTANLAADTKLTTTGAKSFALSAAYTVPASGGLYICVLQDGVFGTTPIQLARVASANGTDKQLDGTSPRAMVATSGGKVSADFVAAAVLTLQDPGSGLGYWLGWA